MTSNTGSQVGTTIKYLPFGGTRAGSVPTDKLFTGQRLDATGLYFYNARYYDATIGRFISPDTVIQSMANPQCLNRYSYCSNNPLKYTDPSGHTRLAGMISDDTWAAILLGCLGYYGMTYFSQHATDVLNATVTAWESNPYHPKNMKPIPNIKIYHPSEIKPVFDGKPPKGFWAKVLVVLVAVGMGIYCSIEIYEWFFDNEEQQPGLPQEDDSSSTNTPTPSEPIYPNISPQQGPSINLLNAVPDQFNDYNDYIAKFYEDGLKAMGIIS
jgi:RHS repeat-associated protein